ncbi:hypothetical protein Fleli_2701 [Bernardetia litoralis DSM 6794]|uniref:Uncharacterized protein n=1 Tax=Bernardetia litoralis (strain ATCC 23117 / DSM 6794 / NBRC 15988 / NCIMB 1366 / Fx l1 / Sio-4) TaxID=880071 RepID=I4AM72_BERLS|nr:hypothetical protein Fleli_2701 [Bernardetia litoralis DSM 6794]
MLIIISMFLVDRDYFINLLVDIINKYDIHIELFMSEKELEKRKQKRNKPF